MSIGLKKCKSSALIKWLLVPSTSRKGLEKYVQFSHLLSYPKSITLDSLGITFWYTRTMTSRDCTKVLRAVIVTMSKGKEYIQRSFKFLVRASLMEQTNAIQSDLVQALMGKDSIISKLEVKNYWDLSWIIVTLGKNIFMGNLGDLTIMQRVCFLNLLNVQGSYQKLWIQCPLKDLNRFAAASFTANSYFAFRSLVMFGIYLTAMKQIEGREHLLKRTIENSRFCKIRY